MTVKNAATALSLAIHHQETFPPVVDAIVIIEGTRERLKERGRKRTKNGFARQPGDVFETFTYLCAAVSVCLGNEFGNT